LAKDEGGAIRLGVVSKLPRLNAWLANAVEGHGRINIFRVANTIDLLNPVGVDVLILAEENIPLQELEMMVIQNHIKGVIIFSEAPDPQFFYFRKPTFPTGWLSAETNIQQFFAAVEAVSIGLTVYGGRKVDKIPQEELIIEPLSKREVEVMRLIIDGMSNSQVAETLFISKNTVKYHLTNIYLKLGVRRRSEAIRKAIGSGSVAL